MSGETRTVTVEQLAHAIRSIEPHICTAARRPDGEADRIWAALPTSTEGLRQAFASGNYLQMYDHRQMRWLGPDESVAAVLASLSPSPTEENPK